MKSHTPFPWILKKCSCGDPICEKYRVSPINSSGLVSKEDGELIASIESLIKQRDELQQWKNDTIEANNHSWYKVISWCYANETVLGLTPGGSISDSIIEALNQFKAMNDTSKTLRLIKAMENIIDATEDKNGQFRAWHNHLRKTTQEAKELLSKS